MKTYIKEQATRQKKQLIKNFSVFNNHTQVTIVQPTEVDLNKAFSSIDMFIPDILKQNVDMIYIGDNEYLKKRQVDALYDNGAIYITNSYPKGAEQLFIEDLVHEMTHAFEEVFSADIYASGVLEEEFLRKRKTLYEKLYSYDFKPNLGLFLKTEYDQNLDKYFFEKVGYERLDIFIQGLFLNEYSVTSLSEYFATGVEYYFFKDKRLVEKISPEIFNCCEEYLTNV